MSDKDPNDGAVNRLVKTAIAIHGTDNPRSNVLYNSHKQLHSFEFLKLGGTYYTAQANSHTEEEKCHSNPTISGRNACVDKVRLEFQGTADKIKIYEEDKANRNACAADIIKADDQAAKQGATISMKEIGNLPACRQFITVDSAASVKSK